jgi:hypothetical protein
MALSIKTLITNNPPWQRKNSSFNAASGAHYLVDNSVGSITATLPASPTDGDTITFKSMAGANDWTIGRNGNDIAGYSEDLTVDLPNGAFSLVWDATDSEWKI